MPKTFTRTKLQDARLHKLEKFLQRLPKKKFNFIKEVTDAVEVDGVKCPTVACAIGWTPKLFPQLVSWNWAGCGILGAMPSRFVLHGAENKSITASSYRDVASELFGVPYEHDIFCPSIFRPSHQTSAGLEGLGKDASPKDVAKMIGAYREKFKAGVSCVVHGGPPVY